MPDPEEDPRAPLVEVGRYARLAEARARGLVVAARGLPHWIERDGDVWMLLVEAGAQAVVAQELGAYEREEEARPKVAPPILPTEKVQTLSLYVAAWVLGTFFFVQQMWAPAWTDRGAAESEAILRGQWWRTLTALTLHADISHLGANLLTGLLFALFALPRLGTGVTWMAIVLSGALGNAINAWGYRGGWHGTIGASTACFGALGILMGAEMWTRWREPQTRNWWQVVLPLGAGLGLLAFFGVGDEGKNVDFMAHLWGFVVGAAEGVVLEVVRVKTRVSKRVQWGLAWMALGWVLGAWGVAWRGAVGE
jgi:membrane associated rhomboid family serine protease